MIQLLSQERLVNTFTEPCQHVEGGVEANTPSAREIAPPNFDASVLAGFRQAHREQATTTAQNTLAAGVSATETILQMAGWIQEMRSRLSRKEFGTFVKGLLQWVGEEARKYLDIARTFADFDLTRLQKLEPFTLLKLCSKRYAAVVERLREESDITPKLVQELIRELLPKQSRKKSDSSISGWKQCRSGGRRYYQVQLHDEQTGVMIEQQAQAEGILPQKVIAEAIALRAKQKSAQMEVQLAEPYVAAAATELDIVHEDAQSHTEEAEESAPTAIAQVAEFQLVDDATALTPAPESVDEVAIAQREVEQYLEQQAQAIAQVPEGAFLAGEDRTEIQWLLNAPIQEVEQVIHEVEVRSAYRALYLLNRFQSGDARRMELLEERVTEYHIAIGAAQPTVAIAPEPVIESEAIEATDYLEIEQESSYLEPAEEDDILLEADEVGDRDVEECLAVEFQQPMKAQSDSQVCQVGDRAKVDLFGAGWDEQPEHPIESHQEFIDDINQERPLQPVGAGGSRNWL